LLHSETWIIILELGLYHISVVLNLKVAPRLLETLWTFYFI